MAITTADRATNIGVKALITAAFTYIAAAALSLGSQALNIPAPVEAATTLLIVAAIAATIGTTAILAALIIGGIQTRRMKGQD